MDGDGGRAANFVELFESHRVFNLMFHPNNYLLLYQQIQTPSPLSHFGFFFIFVSSSHVKEKEKKNKKEEKIPFILANKFNK